jgi:hypothetical protein
MTRTCARWQDYPKNIEAKWVSNKKKNAIRAANESFFSWRHFLETIVTIPTPNARRRHLDRIYIRQLTHTHWDAPGHANIALHVQVAQLFKTAVLQRYRAF